MIKFTWLLFGQVALLTARLAHGIRHGARRNFLFSAYIRLSLMESPAASSPIAVPQEELEAEVIALLISSLNLEVKPHDVTPDTPLYGDGLGLDSIDILEIALAVSKRYGFQMRSDDPRNVESFASIRALSHYIAQERTK
jgi:acyl carrier protein